MMQYVNTPEEVQYLLDQVTYKPKYKFSVASMAGRHTIEVYIHADVIDANYQDRTTNLVHIESMPLNCLTREDFYYWLRETCIKLEIHEVDEFLRWSTTGKPLNDPHA